MDHRWMGPFTITKYLGKGLYALKSCSSDKALDRVRGIHICHHFHPLTLKRHYFE